MKGASKEEAEPPVQFDRHFAHGAKSVRLT